MNVEEFNQLSDSEKKEFLYYLGKPDLIDKLGETSLLKELFKDSPKRDKSHLEPKIS